MAAGSYAINNFWRDDRRDGSGGGSTFCGAQGLAGREDKPDTIYIVETEIEGCPY
jgi:hypothetical protein